MEKKKKFFSDKKIILESIKSKNNSLSRDLKLNIINEQSKSKIFNNLLIKNITIDSKATNKNDIFFAIKGKKNRWK